MKSFTLPITTASELPKAIASHLLTQDRKDWHNAELMPLDACPVCLMPNAMFPGMTSDSANDEVYYFARCKFCEYREE